MSSSVVSTATSRCYQQLGLARRFSSALSLSVAPASSSLVDKVGAKTFSTASFSTASYGSKETDGRPIFVANSMAATETSLFKCVINNTGSGVRRSMGTSNRKVIDAKNAKRLKIQQKKKKNSNASKAASNDNEAENNEDSNSKNPFLQHQEWVRFQQSIKVDGFQTGQTTTATVLKKSRGGKQARRKREKELARLGALSGDDHTEKISAVAQKFPAIRYSPEETEELLKQAYAALPPRDGKRGNRNLRRQENRWRAVRKIRSDYKANLVDAHYRRMEARKYKRDRTRDALESAPDQRQKDLEYQGMVLKRWMDTMDGSKAAADEIAESK